MEIIRYDIQVLNEAGQAIEQYNVPKCDFKKILLKLTDMVERNELYALAIRKGIEKVN